MNTKICKKCGEELPATSECFYKQRGGKYGVAARCKSCCREYKKKHRQDNIDQYRSRDKELYQKNKETILVRAKIKSSKKETKERKSKYYKQYLQTPKGKAANRAKQAKRRALERTQTQGLGKPNYQLIKKIYHYCPEGFIVEHMRSLADGGGHHESNLCYLPENINLQKSSKSIEEFGVEIFLENVIYWQEVLVNF